MRLHPRRALRIILVVSMVLFVLLNFHFIPGGYLQSSDVQLPDYGIRVEGGATRIPAKSNVDIQFETSQKGQNQERGYKPSGLTRLGQPKVVIAPRSNYTQNSSRGPDPNLNVNNIGEIRKEIDHINQEQYVNNLDKFGLVIGSESIVIVVQVHNRVDHLRHLITSLSKVRGIENVLMIMSHDLYSHELNDLVRGISFCPVLQIFFPYSQQIYHNRFPGEDSNDCPRDIKREQAIEKKCNNAEHPDKYGHYREAKYCQTKHHWIWKLRFMFEEILLLDGYEGHVLLLEDDYYVTEDILFTLQMMQNVRDKDCSDCQMLVLGNYEKSQDYKAHGGKVERAYWISSKHNMGMTFTKHLWSEIKKCGKEFCEHDDYNWDWTLQHISMKCIPNKIKLLKIKATRVFHIGECGMHTKSKNCDPSPKVNQVETQLAQNKQYLFSNTISCDGDARYKLRDPKPNGGWGDIRDHNMCLSLLNNVSYFDS